MRAELLHAVPGPRHDSGHPSAVGCAKTSYDSQLVEIEATSAAVR